MVRIQRKQHMTTRIGPDKENENFDTKQTSEYKEGMYDIPPKALVDYIKETYPKGKGCTDRQCVEVLFYELTEEIGLAKAVKELNRLWDLFERIQSERNSVTPGVAHHVESVDNAIASINKTGDRYKKGYESGKEMLKNQSEVERILPTEIYDQYKEATKKVYAGIDTTTGSHTLKFKATDEDTIKDSREPSVFNNFLKESRVSTTTIPPHITPFEIAAQSIDAKIFKVREYIESFEKTLTPILLPSLPSQCGNVLHGYPTPDKKEILQSPLEKWINDVIQDLDGIQNWIADLKMRSTV